MNNDELYRAITSISVELMDDLMDELDNGVDITLILSKQNYIDGGSGIINTIASKVDAFSLDVSALTEKTTSRSEFAAAKDTYMSLVAEILDVYRSYPDFSYELFADIISRIKYTRVINRVANLGKFSFLTKVPNLSIHYLLSKHMPPTAQTSNMHGAFVAYRRAVIDQLRLGYTVDDVVNNNELFDKHIGAVKAALAFELEERTRIAEDVMDKLNPYI